MNKNRIRLTESQLHRLIKESVCKVLREGRKPKDVQHGKHSFKGLRYDRNGNPIYTYDGHPNADTQEKLKSQGWKMSSKHGMYGQISDPTKLCNESVFHKENNTESLYDELYNSILEILNQFDPNIYDIQNNEQGIFVEDKETREGVKITLDFTYNG